jgi:outer membrane protein assembly factor BamB
MFRWWALIPVVAALAGSGFAQDTEQVHNLRKRVKIDHERLEVTNPLDDFDDAAVARLAGHLVPAPVSPAFGYQIAAGIILDRVANERYEYALAEYRRVLREVEPTLSVRPLREYRGSDGLTSRDSQSQAHEWLARLPPSILDRYQAAIDADAAQLLAEGAATHDRAPLLRLTRDYPVSIQADKALALLGDLAFERGQFEQALDWWQRLIPLPSHERVEAQRGEPKSHRKGVDLVRIHAKQTLALIFEARSDAAREVEAFRALYPDARGAFAGRDDAYHKILTHWQNELRPAAGAPRLQPWPTFAGDASRNRILEDAPRDRLWLDGHTWRVSLPVLDVKDVAPVWLSATRSLAIPPTPFHPVIADGQILISDGQTVYSYDLLAGKLRFRASTGAPTVRRKAKDSNDLAFSVSAAHGRAFARLGVRPNDSRPRRLVAIDLLTPGEVVDRVLWTADAAAPPPLDAFFETDPIIVGERVYAGVVHEGDHSSERLLACYDLSGTRLWRTPLAQFDNDPRPPRQSLLAASGSTIVWATHAGGVAAVEAATGRLLWVFRYPAIDAVSSPRGASSCVIADGRVYVAPVDSTNLFCLDLETGQSLWERPWLKGPSDIVAGLPVVSDVVDLLGVVGDRLVFTDGGRAQALDARTGSLLAWQQPGAGKLPGHGRGLLAGPWVFWPTADLDVSWRAVTHADGLLRHPEGVPEYYELTTLRGLPAGNIAFGSGCLAVAGPKELVVYVPAGQQLPQLERDPEAQVAPAKLYRLALAQIEAGHRDDAQATLARLDRLAPAAQLPAWKNLLHDRTSPPTPAKQPAPVIHSAAVATAAPLSSPPEPAAQMKPIWGPLPGFALPIESTRGTARDDITVILEGPEIVFLGTRTGAELFRWERGPGAVAWLGRHGSTFLVAGPEGVKAFDLDARQATWRFDAPDLAATRWRLIDDRPQPLAGPHRFVGFEFLQQTLTIFEDRGRGFALDPKTGTVLAAQGGDDVAPLASDHERQPAVAWRGGRFEAPTRVWRSEPQPIDFQEARRRRLRLENGAALRGETAGVVRLVDASDSDKTLGVYRPDWPTSLTGGAAHLLGDDAVCLTLTPRNRGFELVRLEPGTLRPLWTLAESELRDGFDVRAATWDERALYFIHAGDLEARDLVTGKRSWKRALPSASGRWKVERFGGELIAWPQAHAGLPALAGPVHPVAAALTLAFGRRGIGSTPVLLIAAKDGAVKQRLDVPHDAGPVFVNIQGTRLVVSAGAAVRAWSAVP